MDWRVLTDFAPDRVVKPDEVYYQVQLNSGGNVAAYVAAVKAADPAIDAWDTSQLSDFAVTVIGFSSVPSLLLSTVAALGVFSTVVLNGRERRRDLGMLKSIGMTPRQVVTMVLTSMAVVGVAGGVLGIPLPPDDPDERQPTHPVQAAQDPALAGDPDQGPPPAADSPVQGRPQPSPKFARSLNLAVDKLRRMSQS
ncbi:FtsX-like permease family protein [Micromonospora sp. CA-240977]|uniref:FtsX-like permease family protein n=1 Tax=Micromonospora sp. CA-240977 TaxID=3239957 RepID=UPI003D93C710